MTQLLTQNDKMKKASVRTFNFGIPAYQSANGTKTCPFAKDCVSNCYARQGAYLWGTVKAAYEYRLTVSQQDDFVDVMIKEIKKKKAQAIRIHDSGDFYSREYVSKWLKIIDAMPNVQFYAYTKSIPYFDGVSLPSNFVLIFSNGGEIVVEDSDRHSQVFATLEDLIEAGYVNASEDDTVAWRDTNNKIGLVLHSRTKANKNFVKGKVA